MTAPTTSQWLRTAVDRIAVGSGRLALNCARGTVQRARSTYQRARGWVGDSKNTFDKALRLALLLGAAPLIRKISTKLGTWAYGRIESGAWWWLLWAAAITWTIAAYRVGRDDWEPKQPPAPAEPEDEQEPVQEQAADEEPEPAVEQAAAGLPLPTLPDLRISLAKVGTPHAHIAVLAADIGTSPERVREALDKWQIPVEAVRMQGRGTSTGVKGGPAVHPALALRPEDAAVVAAGEGANSSNSNAFTLIPDGKNPVRTHVVWDTSKTHPITD